MEFQETTMHGKERQGMACQGKERKDKARKCMAMHDNVLQSMEGNTRHGMSR
jgi:hypothetical protein